MAKVDVSKYKKAPIWTVHPKRFGNKVTVEFECGHCGELTSAKGRMTPDTNNGQFLGAVCPQCGGLNFFSDDNGNFVAWSGARTARQKKERYNSASEREAVANDQEPQSPVTETAPAPVALASAAAIGVADLEESLDNATDSVYDDLDSAEERMN